MSDVLTVEIRECLGKRNSKRLRRHGRIPAVLYGHGEGSVSLTLEASEFHHVLRHGAHMVDVEGALSESALVRDVQWDALGVEVLHVDLVRVSKTEIVEVTVAIELRGEAPGTKEGGVVEHSLHELEIECPAAAIPERFEVSVNELHLGQSITASSIALPNRAKLVTDPDQVIVSCVEPTVEEEGEMAEGGIEPELIGGRKDEGEEEGRD